MISNLLTHYQTTILHSSKLKEFADDNFKLDEMAESYPNGKKTLWEKEKLLVTSVFKRLVSQGRQKVSLCGNGLNASCYSQNEKYDFLLYYCQFH